MNLDDIANEYHLKPQPDMFIENLCQEYELEWIKEIIPEGSKVLELGYGDGITFRSLVEYCELSVVDGSKLIIEEARRVAGKLGVTAQIHESFFEDFNPKEKYDFVFASHVLEHVEDPLQNLIKMKTWLKENGKAIIIVPNAQSLHRRLAVLMNLQPTLDTLSERDHKVGHLRVFDKQTLEGLLKNNGWNIEILRGFFLKPLANSQMLNFDSKLINALCNISDELSAEMCANLALVVQPEAEVF